MKILSLIMFAASILTMGACQSKKENGSGNAVDARTECLKQGPNFQYINEICQRVDSAESQCLQTPGYTWQNGACVPQNGMVECQRQGGVWQNGQCLPLSANYSDCRQQTSFQAILQCMQQSTQSFRSLLNSNTQKIRNLDKATRDIDTFSEKTTGLTGQNLTSDMTGLKKLKACWDTTSMINQLQQMSGKLEFSDNQLLVQSQAFIDGMHGAAREMQDRINCPIKS